ncbi:MAG: hypothetical protein GXO28_05445 [Methanopyri archaeon]|nr:hypothetical protein [Methanopyri archaeon]
MEKDPTELVRKSLEEMLSDVDTRSVSADVRREIEKVPNGFRTALYRMLRDEGFDVEGYRWMVEAMCTALERAFEECVPTISNAVERAIEESLEDVVEDLSGKG